MGTHDHVIQNLNGDHDWNLGDPCAVWFVHGLHNSPSYTTIVPIGTFQPSERIGGPLPGDPHVVRSEPGTVIKILRRLEPEMYAIDDETGETVFLDQPIQGAPTAVRVRIDAPAHEFPFTPRAWPGP